MVGSANNSTHCSRTGHANVASAADQKIVPPEGSCQRGLISACGQNTFAGVLQSGNVTEGRVFCFEFHEAVIIARHRLGLDRRFSRNTGSDCS